MTIREVSDLIKGRVLCCEENLEKCIEHAFASDLMSDVLTVEKENILLITGLANLQAIRTAEMSDISFIIFARNKKINNDMIALAAETGIMLIESPYSVFRISGELYKAGVKPVF
jgi:predicted transcriptional regulator